MTDNSIKRVEIIVSGIVHGVFFRVSTREYATKLNLKGTVRNLRDGTVEIIAEGKEEILFKLIGYAKKGPSSAKVYNIDVKWNEPEGKLIGFRIIY
ncbi:MAG: acylphosphatase [Candidatus Heimdallarchaeaceae archaeon]